MRDLEQAKAEVFRRSNARIKKRKTIRRTVIACCVPLVLCMSAFSVTILPAMMPAKSAAPESANTNNMNGMPESVIVCGDSAPAGSIWDRFFPDTEEDAIADIVVSGYYISAEGKFYFVSDEDTAILSEILYHLEYNPYKVCKCLPQYTVVLAGTEYGIHLDEAYARCDDGQASLTEEQLQQIQNILNKYNIN